MPSWRRPYSSARSNCLAFDNSRNAARISAALAIEKPHEVHGAGLTRHRELPARALQMKRQPRFLHRGQRTSLFQTLPTPSFLDADGCLVVSALQRDNPALEP